MTRILHVCNYANIPAVLTRYQRRLGHTVDIVDNDLVNLHTTTNYWEYDSSIISCHGGDELVNWVYYHADDYDLLHLHGDPFATYTDTEQELTDKKPVILHSHGYELKQMNPWKLPLYEAFLVSTPDLWRPGSIWLPNPIDMEIWKHREHSAGNRALWTQELNIRKPDWVGARRLVEAEAKKLGLELTVIERWHDLRPYMSMPEFYHDFDVLMEYKPESNYAPNKFKEPALGLSALECLASGLKVFFVAENRYITEFPINHDARNVVDTLSKIYSEILK